MEPGLGGVCGPEDPSFPGGLCAGASAERRGQEALPGFWAQVERQVLAHQADWGVGPAWPQVSRVQTPSPGGTWDTPGDGGPEVRARRPLAPERQGQASERGGGSSSLAV